MYLSKYTVGGSIFGLFVAAFVPSIAKGVIAIIALVGMYLVNQVTESKIQEHRGAFSSLGLGVIIGPIIGFFRTPLTSVLSFFYVFVYAAAGFLLGAYLESDWVSSEDEDELFE